MKRITPRRFLWFILNAVIPLGLAASSQAEIEVQIGYSRTKNGFSLNDIPPPATNDAASYAGFTVVAGSPDPNSGPLGVLSNGLVPVNDDQPSANFFFNAGTNGGRIVIDLQSTIPIEAVRTYSWHAGARGPQVFTLYGSDGEHRRSRSALLREADPGKHGWEKMARVDTRRSPEEDGGQHAAAIFRRGSARLGDYRYLLFDIETAGEQPYGNTFFSEIDVIAADGPELIHVETLDPIVKSFSSADGKYRHTVDATAAPDLMEWVERKMIPVVEEWYPKIEAMLPTNGYTAPTEVFLTFRSGMNVPGYAAGNRIALNAEWFRGELDREALGCVVHELVHVIQNYEQARQTNPKPAPTPTWISEGIPDYIRWFLYEPEARGAEISERNIRTARYDASYRITANFFHWVVENHDSELIAKLNAAARGSHYSDRLWVEWTGRTIEDLGRAWLRAHEDRIRAGG